MIRILRKPTAMLELCLLAGWSQTASRLIQLVLLVCGSQLAPYGGDPDT